MYTTLECTAGTGESCLRGTVVRTGEGIQVFVGGGDRPHIGTIVICQPRLSLKRDGSISCTTSVLNLMGHKDDGIAIPLAEGLCRELNQVVVVTAGVHLDEATGEEIQVLLSYGQELARQILAQISGQSPELKPEEIQATVTTPKPEQIPVEISEQAWEKIRELIAEQVQAQVKEQIQTQIPGQIRELIRLQMQEQIPAPIPKPIPEPVPGVMPERIRPDRQPKVTEREAAFLQMLAFGTPVRR